MLTHLRIKNFKAWEDTGDIRLAPLTVIFGSNSAGKSSLGHLLLALKQTILATERRKALQLVGDNALIDLGTYEDCVYLHDPSKNISFEASWLEKISVEKSLFTPASEGNKLQLNVEFEYSKKNRKINTKEISYFLLKNDEISLDIKYSSIIEKEFKLTSKKSPSLDCDGYSEPDKFYRLGTTSLPPSRNLPFISDFALSTENIFNKIHHLGPLRESPRRLYLLADDAPDNVGQKGELTIAAILNANKNLARYGKEEARMFSFDAIIARSLHDIGLVHDFFIKPIADDRREHEVFVQVNRYSPEVKITDVGFGISQVLPALVQAYYAEDGSTILMEQPEIHLHPQVQAGLADIFIDALHVHKIEKFRTVVFPGDDKSSEQIRDFGERNVQFIIESHSEHFLTRLQRRIAEEAIKPEEVAIYFVDNKNGKASIEELRINEYGEIENWPENFFGDEMGDLVARTEAAIKRRQQGKTA
jgi:predicted ATPase